jgi:hypothetical protein
VAGHAARAESREVARSSRVKSIPRELVLIGARVTVHDHIRNRPGAASSGSATARGRCAIRKGRGIGNRSDRRWHPAPDVVDEPVPPASQVEHRGATELGGLDVEVLELRRSALKWRG